MRTPMTLARGAITVTVFSTLTAILTSCASDNDKHTGGVQNPTCGLTQTLCKLDASTASTGPYCADLQTENANCGSCGNICHDGKVCSVGSCSAACQAGEKMCSADGTDAGLSHCVNPMNDNASCGDCGHPCAVGEVCSNGQCDLTCPTDETRCGADGDAGTGPYCANTRSDNANCGCCGNACGPNRRCQNGRCDDTTSFSFFVLGDMHVGPTSFNTTVQIAMNQMSQIDANVLTAFSNGDLVDVVSDAQWTEHDSFVSVPGFQLDEFCAASFGAQARYFSTVGDHDIGPAN